jgi:hypothetical protein
MATAQSSAATPSATTGGTWLTRALVVLAVIGAFVLVAVMWIGILGNVHGEEFSPDTFTRRTFEYRELPIMRWRISGVAHDHISGPLERRLQSDRQLLPTSTSVPPRWHVISMVRGSEVFADDAEILKRYLTAGDEDSPYWLKWTESHKDLAQALWPAVAAAARSGQYTRLPDLFETAEQMTITSQTKPTVEEFREALKAIR